MLGVLSRDKAQLKRGTFSVTPPCHVSKRVGLMNVWTVTLILRVAGRLLSDLVLSGADTAGLFRQHCMASSCRLLVNVIENMEGVRFFYPIK